MKNISKTDKKILNEFEINYLVLLLNASISKLNSNSEIVSDEYSNLIEVLKAFDYVDKNLEKQEKNIDKIETKNNSKDNEIPIIIEEKQNEEKEKNIGADNHRSDDTGSIFYHLSSVIFHCIYRNKINCRTNYTACKSAVEFLCTDTCGITGLYHCVWTIFLWICLCIWNMG